jgi:hypothetical protein
LATSLVIPLAADVGYSRLAVRVIWIHVVTHSRSGVVARNDEIG